MLRKGGPIERYLLEAPCKISPTLVALTNSERRVHTGCIASFEDPSRVTAHSEMLISLTRSAVRHFDV